MYRVPDGPGVLYFGDTVLPWTCDVLLAGSSGFVLLVNGKGGTKGMTLAEEWDRLDSETRQWLLDNPGCVVVPRTVSARIREYAAGHIDVDLHGQMLLSREDLDFIRGKGAAVGAGEISEELQFFDTTQPRKRG